MSLVASHKYTLLTPDMERFVPNMTTDANRMEIRHNWDMLMPRKLPTQPLSSYRDDMLMIEQSEAEVSTFQISGHIQCSENQ